MSQVGPNSTARVRGADATERGAAEDAEEADLTRNDTFEVLSNRRRRYMLHYLKASEEGERELSDISTQVAAWENEVDPDGITYADRKNVHTSLYQFHAPKMERAGIIEYDRPSGTIALTDAGEELETYLETVDEKDVPWSQYFLGLSGVTTTLVAGAWAGVRPFTAVDGLSWAAFVTVTFLVSAVAFAHYNRRMRVGTGGAPPELDGR